MKPRIQVHVEPLAETRWARIRQAVHERIAAGAGASDPFAARGSPSRNGGEPAPARTRPWRAWAAAAAVVAVIAVVTASLAWRSLASGGGSLADPSRIATGSTASHVVLDGVSLDLAAESAVVVSGDAAHGVLVVLDRGSVTLDVEHRVAMAGFVVQAGEVRVRVVGTRFKVSRSMDRASVEVDRGTVEVDVGGRKFRLLAGETWRSADDVEATGAPTSAASAAPPNAPPPSAPPPSAVTVQEHGRIRRHVPEPPPGAGRAEKPTTIAPDPAAATAVTRPSAPTSQQLYETAAQLEVTDPARAIALYRQIVARGDSWQADALFAQGRLEAARGDRLQARTTLTQYLARFPRGPNADDARLLLDGTR